MMNTRSTILSILLLGFVTACGGPELNVSFQVPEPYRSVLDRVDVQVFRPSELAPITCDAIALGEIDAEDLGRILDQQFKVNPGEESQLVGIDRVAKKILLARGVHDSGEPVVVGCLEIDEVDDDDLYVIEAEPFVKVEVLSHSALNRKRDDGDTVEVIVRLVDTLGYLIRDGGVRWRLSRPGMTAYNDGFTMTATSGEAHIQARVGHQPGPFGIEFLVRWESESTPSLNASSLKGFTEPETEALVLNGEVRDYQTGRLGPNGEPGLAALVQNESGFRVARIFRDPGSGLLRTIESAVLQSENAAFSVLPARNEPDDLVLLSPGRWRRFSMIDSEESLIADYNIADPLESTKDPIKLYDFSPCNGGPTEFMAIFESGTPCVLSARGDIVHTFDDRFDVLAAGCIGSARGSSRRAFVTASNDDDVGLNLHVEITPFGFEGIEWRAVGQRVGFLKQLGQTPDILVGTQLRFDSYVVSGVILERARPKPEIRTWVRVDAPALLQQPQGGDFDGDGRIDLAALTRVPSLSSSADSFALWTALDVQPNKVRLDGYLALAYAEEGETLLDPQLLAVDFNQDGLDELVVAERPPGNFSQTSRVFVMSL